MTTAVPQIAMDHHQMTILIMKIKLKTMGNKLMIMVMVTMNNICKDLVMVKLQTTPKEQMEKMLRQTTRQSNTNTNLRMVIQAMILKKWEIKETSTFLQEMMTINQDKTFMMKMKVLMKTMRLLLEERTSTILICKTMDREEIPFLTGKHSKINMVMMKMKIKITSSKANRVNKVINSSLIISTVP